MDRRGEGRGEDRAGLVGLGLIMELVGSVVAAYLIVKSLEPVLDRVFRGFWYPRWEWQSNGVHAEVGSRPPPFHVAILATVGVLRALVHRRAGSAVLYRSGDAATAVGVYAAVALGHTALCVLAFWLHHDHQSLAWSVAASLSLGWPIALLVAIRRPAIRQALRQGRAATAPSATDQAATLMIFFGLVGCLVALFALYAAMNGPLTWSQIAAWPPLVVTVLLCVRSAVHTRVGVRLAGGGAGADGPLDGSTYVKVALITATISWIAIAILMRDVVNRPWVHYPTTDHVELAWQGLAVYLLFAWPLLLRRLARVRADVAEPAQAAVPRHLSGLSALGWLLLAAGVVQLGFAGLWLSLGSDEMKAVSMAFVAVPLYDMGLSRGLGLQLLIAVPQVWVAVELLRGSPRVRRAATTYAACASVATVLSIRSDMELLYRVIGKGLPDPTRLLFFLSVAFWLLVPIATLVFVQNQLRRADAPAPVDSSSGEG